MRCSPSLLLPPANRPDGPGIDLPGQTGVFNFRYRAKPDISPRHAGPPATGQSTQNAATTWPGPIPQLIEEIKGQTAGSGCKAPNGVEGKCQGRFGNSDAGCGFKWGAWEA